MKRISLLVIATAALIAGCGGSHSSRSTSAAGGSHSSGSTPAAAPTVVISAYAFHPADLTVASGTRVTFVNRDQTAHTATSTTGAFDAGAIQPGASRTIVLSKPGSYPYYCQFHAFMRGEITVK